jgi:cyclophilin family peptidyl-prolyl cis-trans isomerase
MTDRRQRQKEQRAAKKEAEKKQAARKELRRRLITALGFGLVVVVIFAVGAFFSGDNTALPGSYEGFRGQTTACGAEQPPAEAILRFDEPEPQTDITASSTVTATLATSCGDIVIELDAANTETVNSFVFLAREGFYDGHVFHRILADFLVQTGDPEAMGVGGPGYEIEDEFPPEDFVYTPGVVAMQNAGKGTTGSEFFIVLDESASVLNPQFNVLGTLVSGQEALDQMVEIETALRPGTRESSLPLETVYIESVSIDVTGS